MSERRIMKTTMKPPSRLTFDRRPYWSEVFFNLSARVWHE
jgi:hypothetical protein